MNISFGSKVKIKAYEGRYPENKPIKNSNLAIAHLPFNVKEGLKETAKALEENGIKDSVEISYVNYYNSVHTLNIKSENGYASFNPFKDFIHQKPTEIKDILIKSYTQLTGE